MSISITEQSDIVTARGKGRSLSTELGFSKTDGTLVATAISEIARNIIVHAGSGEVVLSTTSEDTRCGIRVVTRDAGPGIRDVSLAMQDGYSSKGAPGLGLPGARRLMDEFEISTGVGRGTTVTMTKWRNRSELEQMGRRG